VKSIIVPKTIKITVPTDDGDQVLDLAFADFVTKSLLADPKASHNMDAVYANFAMRQALAASAPGKVWAIDDTHYAMLLEIMKAPTGGYHPVIAVQAMPFFEAIKHAVSGAITAADAVANEPSPAAPKRPKR
jgi:hypothetical protein